MEMELISFSMVFFFIPFCNSKTTFPVNVWPKPTSMSWPNPRASPLSPTFQIICPYINSHLQSAVRRYADLLLNERYHPVVPPVLNLTVETKFLQIRVADLSVPLEHGVDESYSLSNFGGAANLTASTVWGAIHGLETFLQLTWGDPPVVAAEVYVYDYPIYPHRGLMLDTSRSYYPIADIKRTIATMGANKLNVFHWHITDSQSFPILLPSEPKLAEKGSYGPAMQYLPEDVTNLVEFAMDHAVRVIPEIDSPAHSGSWAEAYPEIVACANKFWLPDGLADWADRLASEPGTGQLNPLHPKTYNVVRNVYRDIAGLFPDNFFHGGADEVVPGCWKSDPAIQKFLASGGTLSDLLKLYVNTTHPFIVSLNRTAVYWEDVILDAVIHVDPTLLPPEDTIMQTWNNGVNNTKLLTALGYRVIVSSWDFYYLDCGSGDFVGNNSLYDQQGSDLGSDGGSWCGPYKTWQRVYDYDIVGGLSEEEAALVIGGEVALWSEVADSCVLDSKLWPRTAAMAEAMWSGNRDARGKKRYAEATDRLNDWRYRMVGRGIRAEPIQPLWCRKNPGMCNYM